MVLYNEVMRKRAHDFIDRAPKETRVIFQGPRRTNQQSDKMWAMLGEVSEQAMHHGRKYDSETWKAIFMSALGQETRFVPNLDGTGLIPIGHRSSELSKEEMSELIELIYSAGAERGVVFHDPAEQAA